MPGLKLATIKFLLACCALLAFQCAWSQKGRYQFAAVAEKIYLQLDSKIYLNSQTIWFKAVVTNAAEHQPTILSGVLYVELISENEQLVDRKLIKIEKGIGEGFFELNTGYPEGRYLVRAYTEWNKNFDDAFIFKEYIQVFAVTPKTATNPVRNVTIIEEGKDTRRIRAVFDPAAIDSAHSKDLALYLSFDTKKDTLLISKNKMGEYTLDYIIPDHSPFIALKMQTKSHISYVKSIMLAEDYLELQFFPESGELVHGLPGVLGFKALDSVGKGKLVEGEIINSKEEVIARFSSNVLGMGTVRLVKADSNEHYMARVISVAANNKLNRLYRLPDVVSKGNVLSVIETSGIIHVNAFSNYLKDDSVSVRISCRGVVYFDIKGRLKNGLLRFGLPDIDLPAGVIAFTLMDDSHQAVAERLYFNHIPGERLNISVAPDKEIYHQREQAKLGIEVKNNKGQPVSANLSVLVFNKDGLNTMQESRQNILSYFLLSSDLKGNIERPGFYFTKSETRTKDIDALLLTQGWRRYNYSKTEGKIVFQPEFTLTVSGTVTGGLFGNKQKKGTSLTMMSFGEPPSADTQIADSLGRFSFLMNDNYQQTVNVLIQTTNQSGTKKDYTITLDKKENPTIGFDHLRVVERPDSMIRSYVKKSLDYKKTTDDYIAKTEGITLGEVVVKSYVMTPERKEVADRYGKPKLIIEGDDIRDKEAKWSYGLYSILLFNFPDKIRVTRAPDGTLYARVLNSELTLVVVDGIPVRPHDYVLIPNIPPSEVKSFEVIEYAKNFSSLYCDLFPQSCLHAPAVGNVIAIYTYGKIGIFGANRAPGIMTAAVPVFSTPREFYAPKHDQLKKEDWLKPDLRTLIHWLPRIQTDSSGNASVSFFNSDVPGNVQVIVEAISAEGKLGYQQLNFEVKKRKEEKDQ